MLHELQIPRLAGSCPAGLVDRPLRHRRHHRETRWLLARRLQRVGYDHLRTRVEAFVRCVSRVSSDVPLLGDPPVSNH